MNFFRTKFHKISSKQEWNRVLKILGCFDFYHTYEYHEACSFYENSKPVMFCLELSSEKLIALPLLERKIEDNFFDGTSVYGYTGPISNVSNSGQYSNAYRKLILMIRNHDKYISIFSRVNILTTPTKIATELFSEAGSTVFINLSLTSKEQISQYRKNLRYDIRKLHDQGVNCNFVEHEKELDSFIGIYNEAMENINADDFYFFPKSYYKKLFNNSFGDAKMVFCKKNSDILAVGIFLFCNGIVQYHLGANNSKFSKSSGTKLIIDYIRDYAFKNGYKTFHLGGGYGGKEDSLLNFKKGFSKKELKFFLIKEVINVKKYSDLSINIPHSHFFPLYRSQ